MKKHSREEILLKLGQADQLARAGKSQVEICKTLGVSVMTFHRWRKRPLMAGPKNRRLPLCPNSQQLRHRLARRKWPVVLRS